MNEFEFFVRAVDDLRLRATASADDEYEVLRAAGIIRQLLMDSHCLVDHVNRTLKQQVRFGVHAYDAAWTPSPDLPQPVLAWTHVAPVRLAPRYVSREQLLAFKVLQLHGNTYSVKDIVRVCAHQMGGVHYGAANGPTERALLELNGSISIDQGPFLISTVAEVGRVVCEGLEPLRLAANAVGRQNGASFRRDVPVRGRGGVRRPGS